MRTGAGEETVIGYDATTQELYVDGTRSGPVGFNTPPARECGSSPRMARRSWTRPSSATLTPPMTDAPPPTDKDTRP
ncbi:hypothetical protein [Streptomyces phaeochromogenes]